MDFNIIAGGIATIVATIATAVSIYVTLRLKPIEDQLKRMENYDRWRGETTAKLNQIIIELDWIKKTNADTVLKRMLDQVEMIHIKPKMKVPD